MTTGNYLNITEIYKSFGDAKILKGINLACKQGELICLLGPSGCGKTTLLRIIAGLEIQDSGTLIQDGEDISDLPAQERDFGIVFQSYALFPNLTVEKNISYGLRNHENKEERVAELMAMVDLTEHAKKYPSQMSGGQQQRVALARALAIKPNLLLLDEPLSALDAKVREYLRQEIKSLQQKLGVTTLMVTHDQEEAMSMADQIVVMHDGRIEQVGTPYEIYHHPATPFVADFVGTMNFIPAIPNISGGVSCLGMHIDCQNVSDNSKVVTIGVRPEHIIVNAKLSTENSVVVKVDKIEFLGAFIRLHTIETDARKAILVDINIEQFTAENITVEKRVALVFRPENIKIYKALGGNQ